MLNSRAGFVLGLERELVLVRRLDVPLQVVQHRALAVVLPRRGCLSARIQRHATQEPHDQ